MTLAEKIWNELKASNSDLAESFASLTRLANDDVGKYGEEVEKLAGTVGDQVSFLFLFCFETGRLQESMMLFVIR